jgi:WD40 repeat protein
MTKATKNKKKLFTFTEINDNVVEVFRSRTVKTSKGKTKNLWKYFGSLDENKEVISQLVLSDDEQYMLGCMSTGFKVYYLMTGQSKPLKLPAGVKNINIGYKKMTFTAVFSKENKYVVAGVKDNIYIWETSYGIFIKTLDAHYGRISKMLHNVNGLNNLVISGSMDKTIKIWNIQNILEEDFPLDHLDKQIEMLHVSVQAGIAMAQSRNQLVVISLKNGRIKYPLCNSPHGAIFTCSALNNTGTIAASSESNKLVVWDVEQKTTTFVSSTQSKTIPIMQLQFHQSDQYVLCAYLDQTHKVVSLTNYMLPDGDIVYTEEIQIKTVNDYKPFMLTSDDMYLVFFRDDKKGDMLAVHMAADGSLQHNIKLSYPNFTANFSAIVPFYESPFMVAIIDNEKGNIINCRDKKFIRSIKNWNGKMTRDDKFGLYAPGRGGLEFLDLKSALRAKVFIPKVAEGVFDVDTLITPNDMHIIYYHSGKRTIRVYRISDCKKVADYKSAAKVRTMICTQDSRALVFGCEDGTVNMMIIADPLDEESVANLRAWRADQMTLYARDGRFLNEI